MRLPLTEDQAKQATAGMQPGMVLLGRIMREPFAGDNPQTCGRWILECGTVAEKALPALRAAIVKANQPRKARTPKP